MTIEAIETAYAGVKFRSRLEARWAVFFDALKVRWEYEPEGLQTTNGWYLPDFRLHLAGGLEWFEVKPTFVEDDPRWCWMYELRGCTEIEVEAPDLYVSFGMPQSPAELEPWHQPGMGYIQVRGGREDFQQAFVTCSSCGQSDLCYLGAEKYLGCRCERKVGDTAAVERAYLAARVHRFWDPKSRAGR